MSSVKLVIYLHTVDTVINSHLWSMTGGLGNYPHGLGNGQIWVHTPSHAEFDGEQDGRGDSAQQGPRKEEMSF